MTNPAIDPFREAIVTSIRTYIGPQADITTSTPDAAKRLELDSPVLKLEEMEALKAMNFKGWRTKTLDATWPLADGPVGLEVGDSSNHAMLTTRFGMFTSHSLCSTADTIAAASCVAAPA